MPESQRIERLEDPDDPGIAGITTVRMLGSLAHLAFSVNTLVDGWRAPIWADQNNLKAQKTEAYEGFESRRSMGGEMRSLTRATHSAATIPVNTSMV